MKILLLSPFLPHSQARSGAPRAIFDRLQMLSRVHDISVATYVAPDEAQYIAELEHLGVRVHAVARQQNISGKSGSGLWRKRIRLAVGLLMDKRPMLVQEFGSRSLRTLLQRMAREERFDVVLLEHILMAQYLP